MWDAFVRNRFVYTSDDVKHDSWRSHAVKLLDDRDYVMRDDCDGLASTVLHLLQLDGWNNENLYRAMVKTIQAQPTDWIDHMIGIVRDDDGKMWIVGDTFGPPVALLSNAYGHKIVATSRVSEGAKWRDSIE